MRMAQILSVMNGVRISLEQPNVITWNVNCMAEETFFLQTVELKKFLERFRSIFKHFYSRVVH